MKIFYLFQIVINIIFVTLAGVAAGMHFSDGNSSAGYGWGLAGVWCFLFTVEVMINFLGDRIMIDEATLKKRNLKAVPFSAIGEGQTFIDERAFGDHLKREPSFYAYRLRERIVEYVKTPHCNVAHPAYWFDQETVYVPIWRPC